jgi:AraC-like DNA-binding protein
MSRAPRARIQGVRRANGPEDVPGTSNLTRLNCRSLVPAIPPGLIIRAGFPLPGTFNFRSIAQGIESFPNSFSLPRHRHLRSYATVVLAGSLVESGYIGRIRATTGDVLIHPALDCHGNQKVCAGVRLIRLDWSETQAAPGFYRLDEVDTVARMAESNVGDAARLLEDALHNRNAVSPNVQNDWPDLLAAALAQNASTAIGDWARATGLASETVSRGFTAAYGIAPEIFRAELRAREAWLRITQSPECLCTIAAETGFSDQAHMTRWVHRITGAPPGAWRRKAMSA